MGLPATASSRAGSAARGPTSSEPVTIMFLSGRMKMADRLGHHDYAAGCALLADLVAQTDGVRGIVVRDGWPADETIFDTVRTVVCYSGGRHKHPFFSAASRRDCVQRLVDRGVGLVMLHQAVRCPPEHASLLTGWIGGAHVVGESARGHWRTHHSELPVHPVTRGLQSWTIRDGWLREIRFVDGMRGVTPLLWSSRRFAGSSAGGAPDVVAWIYQRPGGGRSFCFTGLDAHSAWSVPAVRQLVVNGILFSAGLPIPAQGAPCAIEAEALPIYLTPRGETRPLRLMLRRLRRLAGR